MDWKKLAPALAPVLMTATAAIDPTVIQENPLVAALVAALVAFVSHLLPSPVKK